MANITIRKLDSNTLVRLRERATNNGRSLEEEACAILTEALEFPSGRFNLAASIRSRIDASLRADLQLPSRN